MPIASRHPGGGPAPWRILRVLCMQCAVAASAMAQTPGAPQQPEPTFLTFSMVVDGKGSDPDKGTGIRDATQSWTYHRVIGGFIEVDVEQQREGRGATSRDLIVYTKKRGGRHAITGERSDWAKAQEVQLGEGFDVGGWASYKAEESFDAVCGLDPKDLEFEMALDTGNKVWDAVFVPVGWFNDIESASRYSGFSEWKPNLKGGFGEPWTCYIDDPDKSSGDGSGKFVDVRYHPGRMGLLPVDLRHPRQRAKALFNGAVATGEINYDVPPPQDAAGSWDKMHVTLNWSVTARLPDVELEVRSLAYATWRPKATDASAAAERTSAAGIEFTAELRAADGNKKALLPRIESVEWVLVGTSREPGISMNFPYQSDDRRADLELAADDGAASVDAEKQALVFQSPDGPITRATVYPFDWGGFATLRVTARLVDGRSIEGILKGAPGVTASLRDIPVPCSPPGSHIALCWLRQWCPGWHSDAADDDAFPPGKPGIDGDGFSVYEEYRGFHTFTKQESTDPTKKDLFVRNDAGFQASGGIRRFFALSKLTRHWLFARDLPRAEQNERVVNCNVGAGASNGPQTAIYLRPTATFTRMNDRIPSGSRPATVAAILVPDELESLGDLSSGMHVNVTFRLGLYDAIDTLVAQAMFQTVGVDRPGPSGKIMREVFVPASAASDGKPHFLLDDQRVVLLCEDGRDLAAINQERFAWLPTIALPRYRLVAGTGSAHSGPVDCVMRDWFADYYPSKSSRDGFPVYFQAGDERPGARLGSTRLGTGFNRKGNLPESRYGDSAVAEPANRQLVVRDNAP
jgi:hypothetical protein